MLWDILFMFMVMKSLYGTRPLSASETQYMMIMFCVNTKLADIFHLLQDTYKGRVNIYTLKVW